MARRVLGCAGHPAVGCGFRVCPVCPVIVARQRLESSAKTDDRKTSDTRMLSRLEKGRKGCVKNSRAPSEGKPKRYSVRASQVAKNSLNELHRLRKTLQTKGTASAVLNTATAMRALAPEVPAVRKHSKAVPQGLKPPPIAYSTARLKPCPSFSNSSEARLVRRLPVRPGVVRRPGCLP
jgi:hypothetical protein